MTAFFVRTDASIVGPFTGVELREAALAGILFPDSLIAGSPQGPWYPASGIGLFSEKKTPLPHPPGTVVPQYQVRGMAGAFQGPFKLRELIGFAARGMLPADALLQSDPAALWISASRFRILAACLSGDLVLLDRDGRIINRATHITARKIDLTETRVPASAAKNTDHRDKTTFASETRGHVPPIHQSVVSSNSKNETDTPEQPRRDWFPFRIRLAVPDQVWYRLHPRRLAPVAVTLLLFAAVGSAFSYWKQIPMHRNSMLGEWIGSIDDTSEPSFGIAFHDNNQCVIVNTTGDCWSGDFEWLERSDDQIGFDSAQTVAATIDVASPSHATSEVRSTDGYLVLSGIGRELPTIEGHPVRDLFVRRQDDQLWLGYPISVTWTRQSKVMLAAWIVAQHHDRPSDHRLLEPIESSTSLADLIATHGIPDEARRIYRFEMSDDREREMFVGSQVVRYGEQKFLVTPAGEFRAVEMVSRLNLPVEN